jgi:peptide/nickel transport system permease protein
MKRRYKIYIALLLLVIFTPLISNNRPLYVNLYGEKFFPAFTGNDIIIAGGRAYNLNLQLPEEAYAWYPIIPWKAGQSDLLNIYSGPAEVQYMRTANGSTVKMPLRSRHWLGTDSRGSDVLAGILSGLRYSMFIALVAVLTALLAGLAAGAAAGYFGNNGLRMQRVELIWHSIAIFYSAWYFYTAGSAEHFISDAAITGVIYIAGLVLLRRMKNVGRTKSIGVPVDSIIMRIIEVLTSMPRLILILSLAALLRPTYLNLALILGLSLSPEVARFVRAQVLQIRTADFITAAKALGFGDARILFNHILRNGAGPLIVLLCFAFANVMLTEAGLAFIGVALPQDAVTWGSLLSSARENFSAWWLIVFPGGCLLAVVYHLNRLADRYQMGLKEKRIIA